MMQKLIATMALAVGLTAAAFLPASARGFGGGGFHGGFGGFHGGFGGFHGGFGGFHGGFVRPGFGHPAFVGRFPNRFGRRVVFVGAGSGWGWGWGGGGWGWGGGDWGDWNDWGYSGNCYLQRVWVWNGVRNVPALARVCQ